MADSNHSPLARKSADWSHRPDMTSSQPTELEVVLLGAPRVGKTAIAEQFLYRQFRESYKETVEEFHWIEYECDDGRTFMLKLIDTSGSHEFLAMRNLYLQKGHAFVLVWSDDVENSFEELKHLRNAIKECNLKNSPVIIVTNKIDLADEVKKHQTTKEDVQIFAMETNCTNMEVSAKEYESVEKIFRQLLHKSPHGSTVPDRLKKRRQSMPANVESAQKNNKQGRTPLLPAPDEHQKNGCVLS